MAEVIPDEQAIPRKVRVTATAYGVHADCIAVGYTKMCLDCHHGMERAFDHHYGHLPTPGDVLVAVWRDFVSDGIDEAIGA